MDDFDYKATSREATSLGQHAAAAGTQRSYDWVGKALLAIGLLFLLQAAKPVVVPVLVALLIAAILLRPVHRLQRIGLSRYLSAGLMLLALITVVALAGSLLARPAVDWWGRTPGNLQQVVSSLERLRSSVPLLAPPAQPSHLRQALPPPDPLKEKLTSEGVALTGVALMQFGSFAFATGATLILSYLLLIYEQWVVSHLVAMLPGRRQRAMVLGGLRDAQHEIGRYFFTMSLANIGLGLATGAALMWLGLPNGLFWGAAAGLLNFIPYFGPVMTTALLLLTGVSSYHALGAMLAPAGAFLLLNGIESNLLSPWFVGRRLQMSQLAIFFSVLLWGWMWGVAGALLALPILICLRCVCRRRYKLLCQFLERSSEPPPSLSLLLKEPSRRAQRR